MIIVVIIIAILVGIPVKITESVKPGLFAERLLTIAAFSVLGREALLRVVVNELGYLRIKLHLGLLQVPGCSIFEPIAP